MVRQKKQNGIGIGKPGVDDVDALIPTVMAHGQGNAEHVSDGSPSLTCNHEAPILFDTTQITSKGNYSHPKPGDACHPLASQAHPPAVAIGFDYQQGGDTQQQATLDGTPPIRPKNRNAIAFPANMSGTQRATSEDVSPNLQAENPTAIAFQPRMVRTTGGQPSEELNHALGASAGGGDSVPHVAISQQVSYGTTNQTDSIALLRSLRNQIGEEALTEWGLGILNSFYTAEILRQALHGSKLRPAAFPGHWLVLVSSSREADHAAGAMLTLRETKCEGRSSQGQELSQQFYSQLGAYMSRLSQPGAQASEVMLHLWESGEGIGVLREALSAIQATWQSACVQRESTHSANCVRRLVPVECEFLQGLPRGWTESFSDSVRYRMIGNSVAVPVFEWVARRIHKALTENENNHQPR